MLTDEEIEIRRQWQEQVYNDLQQTISEQEVEVLDKKFTVLPGMFAPLWGDSSLLAKTLMAEVKSGNKVLDLGTGSGIQGIFSAENGAKVLSVDINEQALKCAQINIAKHNLQDKIEVRQSDLFTNISERFNIIIFNPPFRWFKPRDMLERGEVDENYQTLQRFFAEAKNYLLPGGRIILVFSESGDEKYLDKLIADNNYHKKMLVRENINSWNYTVYELTI